MYLIFVPQIYTGGRGVFQRLMLFIFFLSFFLFLAATKQLWEFRLSVRPSVRPSHFVDHIPLIVSSWNFQELVPMPDVMSMQKVKVKGQGHRGHDTI